MATAELSTAGQQRVRSPAKGRPRNPLIDEAVLAATLRLLDDVGYHQLTLDAIAREAGTNKPAIYRRWPSVHHLVLAALGARLDDAATPDTGCTLCDLNEGINVFIDTFAQLPADVLGPLHADCSAHSALRAVFMATLFEPPRAAVAQMIDRAIARGDLRDDVDRTLMLDLLGSLVHFRTLFGHAPTSAGDVERAVEVLMRGAAQDYNALLEHSRRMAGDPQIHPQHSDTAT